MKIHYTDEQIKATIEKWNAKKCLACGHSTNSVEFAGLLYPYHMYGFVSFEDSASYTSGLPPVVSKASLSPFELFKIVFSTTCSSCGHISLWRGQHIDVVALVRNADSGGVYLGGFVVPDALEDAINHSHTKWIKDTLQGMLNIVKEAQGEENE